MIKIKEYIHFNSNHLEKYFKNYKLIKIQNFKI